MTMMSDATPAPEVKLSRIGRYLACSCVVMGLVPSLCILGVHTVGSFGQRLGHATLMGFLWGTMLWLILCLPVMLLLWALAMRLRLPDRWYGRLFPVVLVALGLFSFGSRLEAWLPGHEQKFFERRTGKAWPAEARLTETRHYFALSDAYQCWQFESSSPVLKAFIQASEWHELDEEDIPEMSHFPQADREWKSVKAYAWFPDKEATEGPLGTVFLLVDSTGQRWCVYRTPIG